MASDVKWIKITTDMFDNRKIKYLRRLPDGNNIVLIWVMLLTMAGRCNSGGMIFLTENIPYTAKMLSDELDFEENTVQLALKALEQLNMVVMDEGFFRVSGWEEYQNIEGMEKIREQNRLRKAAQRARQNALIESSRESHVTVTQCHAEEEEKELDIKSKNKKNKSVHESTHDIFSRLLPEYAFSDEMKEKMEEWITYKTERKETYKEQGMKSLLRQVENNAMKYGAQAVCDLIDECMASGWKGIIFDRLSQKQGKSQPYQQGGYKKQTKAEELDDFYHLAADWAGSE
jgi:predicted phage replisome organizer